eukprot:3832875-Alexandrium_andersonii.AAC.1
MAWLILAHGRAGFTLAVQKTQLLPSFLRDVSGRSLERSLLVQRDSECPPITKPGDAAALSTFLLASGLAG